MSVSGDFWNKTWKPSPTSEADTWSHRNSLEFVGMLTRVLQDFQLDFARQYFIIEVSAGLVAEAASLARRHGLRGYDAVQLAAALEVHAKVPSLTRRFADADLSTTAAAEG